MNRFVYLSVLILVVIFLSSLLANMQTNNPGSGDNATSSNEKPEIIHVPEVTDRGQLLHENHCMACHNDSVNSRNNTKAHSVDDIRQWVVHWSKHLELEWEKHDVDEVTNFLNRRYYHFTTEE